MGSKTPENYQQEPDGSSHSGPITSVNPQKPSAASCFIHSTLAKQDSDDDDDDSDKQGVDMNVGSQNNQKKKRKRNKGKKKKRSALIQQSVPPRVPLHNVFRKYNYPEGEVVSYAIKNDNLQRTTDEELRHVQFANDMDEVFLADYRKAAEVHRQVRQHAQTIAKPGITMRELAEEIEAGVRTLVGHQGIELGDALKAGMGFPTGLCLNNVAAHWTPNPGAKDIVLQHDDVLSVDFGVHVNGCIVDSAFTLAFDPVYDPLLVAVKAATNTGLKEAGIDARISHISGAIQEVMESYEISLNNRTIPIKAVHSLTGHNILRYKIHGDKQVPFVKSRTTQRMEEGDVFAIETFGTTGKGRLRDDIGVYGYSRNENVSAAGLQSLSAKALLKTIDQNFGTLPFSKSYLERVGVKGYHLGMKTLVENGIVECYAPLVDVPGSYVAQFEHTVLLRPNCKEIVSRGDDY